MTGDNTVINPEIARASHTTVNCRTVEATELNPTLLSDNNGIPAGYKFSDKYEVICPLEATTGEADLYVCRYRNSGYVAKVYRRKAAIKDDVVDAIQKIKSPFIANLYDVGTYNEYPYEILTYYKHGSLQGRTFSFEELKAVVIPSINEGLRLLHKKGVIHKDLKPSNIMLCDDQRNIAIIDFGISSVRDANSTVVLTKTGMTPEYSAPETFRSLFLAESDYYSFGITLYELYCGYTPYKNMDRDSIERYVSVQRLPFPDNMPGALVGLISALTYHDITNRKNKYNPNRRWTYDEVDLWLKGEVLPIPGDINADVYANPIPPYKFLEREVRRMPDLVAALGSNWDDGKKQLFRGLMTAFFKTYDPETAGFCMDAKEEAAQQIRGRNKDPEDLIFYKLLCRLYLDNKAFYWKSLQYESLESLGDEMIASVHCYPNSEMLPAFFEIIEKKLISTRIEIMSQSNSALYKAIVATETGFSHPAVTERAKLLYLAILGYLLTDKRNFNFDGVICSNTAEFAEHLKNLATTDRIGLERCCNTLINSDNNLKICLEAWLIAIGKRAEVVQWQKQLASVDLR
jgi:serine/threonine protein kinase